MLEEDIWKEAKTKASYIMQGDKWVKWIHEGISPATTNAEKIKNITLAALSMGKHCAKCMNINGCCFPQNNMPEYPLHPNCHCKLKPINRISIIAECEIIKFTKYIFDSEKNLGKKALFESWGYDIIDADWLKADFERQAKEAYESGNFILGLLNDYGQRITVIITLP